MQAPATLQHPEAAFNSAIKLKLSSQRLSSSRCQVRFQAQHKNSSKPTKGHMLVDPSLSLREVSQIIRQRINMLHEHGTMQLSSFYCISGRENGSGFIFFDR